MMNKFNIINNDLSLEEVKERQNSMNTTSKTPNNFKVYSSVLLLGFTLVQPSGNIDYKNLISDKNYDLSETYQTYHNPIKNKLDNYPSEIDLISSVKRQIIIQEIESLKNLEYNWDGYDGIPLEELSGDNAIKLLKLIDENTLNWLNYYPNPHGTLSLEWENEDEDIISIEIGNNTLSYFVNLSDTKDVKYYNNVEVNVQEVNKISKFIQTICEKGKTIA